MFTQHMQGFTYSDVLALPVWERRSYLNLKSGENKKRNEEIEDAKENAITTKANSKGNRQSKIGGETLKTRLKNGEIPLS